MGNGEVKEFYLQKGQTVGGCKRVCVRGGGWHRRGRRSLRTAGTLGLRGAAARPA